MTYLIDMMNVPLFQIQGIGGLSIVPAPKFLAQLPRARDSWSSEDQDVLRYRQLDSCLTVTSRARENWILITRSDHPHPKGVRVCRVQSD